MEEFHEKRKIKETRAQAHKRQEKLKLIYNESAMFFSNNIRNICCNNVNYFYNKYIKD